MSCFMPGDHTHPTMTVDSKECLNTIPNNHFFLAAFSNTFELLSFNFSEGSTATSIPLQLFGKHLRLFDGINILPQYLWMHEECTLRSTKSDSSSKHRTFFYFLMRKMREPPLLESLSVFCVRKKEKLINLIRKLDKQT